MPDTELKRLFLSYGRTDAVALADRLADDLRNHTILNQDRYEAWKDRAEIKSGVSWADQIVDALRDVAAVVAILTPQAVRTRSGAETTDSVCLDEIAYARFAAKKPIVPAMAIPCEPPFEIYRLDYVDFTGWKDDQAYRVAFNKLLDSIVAVLRGEARYRRWDDRLQPWDFGSFLAGKRRDFVGREWLFDKVQKWLDEPDEQPTLLIVGEPGIGKSAIVAELVHRNFGGRVLAYHCCQSTAPETLRPGRFVRSVAGMIASRHPAYEALIEQSPYRDVLIEDRSESDPESAFEQGVLAPLERVGPPSSERRMLVIDALDEALRVTNESGPTVISLLARALDRLPAWLRIVATSRPDAEVLDALASLRPSRLEAQDPDNLKDLSDYIMDRLTREPVAARLAASSKDAVWVTAALSGVSKGNFLYAQQALDALAKELLQVEDLGRLPPGLSQQFQWFFERQFGAPGRWTAIEPLFESLVVAQEPIGERELQAATGLDAKSALPQALEAVASYLRLTQDEPPRRAIYHRSLVEWLTDSKRRGKMYWVSAAAGHKRLAEGLLSQYRADRLNPSRYTLAFLPVHLAEAARSSPPAERFALQRSLTEHVLDPIVQQQRVEEPFGVNASLGLALETAASGPPIASAPLVFELALGWQAFRRERLDARRLFDLAQKGQIDAFERELQLYPADEQWTAAARLVAAWLSIDTNRDAASQLRQQARTGTALDERVGAEFEKRPAQFDPIVHHPGEQEVTDIFKHVGGTDAEPVNPSMLWDQAAPPPAGGQLDHEGVRYLAEFHAPVLVAYAQDNHAAGTQRVGDYIRLNAANAYREYRNGSLWQILRAVSRHRDAPWVRIMAPPIVAAALAGAGRDFTRATELTLLVLRGAADPERRQPFEMEQKRLLSVIAGMKALGPQRGRDPWAEYRRSIAAIAEARRKVLKDDPLGVLLPMLDTPDPYAGFNAPACLTLAESFLVCGAPPDRIDRALHAAHKAAQNIQDLVFCARTVSRITALTERWWKRPPLSEVQLAGVIDRFYADPRSAEFSATHVIGETYPDRLTVNPTSRLPDWLLKAKTLNALAGAYQWPLPDFVAINQAIATDATLQDGTRVLVPDRRWAPMLAAYFASLVVHAPAFSQEDRVRLMLKLVVRAADPTALDTVLARLLILLNPNDDMSLAHFEQVLRKYPLPPSEGAAFEPTT